MESCPQIKTLIKYCVPKFSKDNTGYNDVHAIERPWNTGLYIGVARVCRGGVVLSKIQIFTVNLKKKIW
jgi:hypothetical protein